MILSDADFDHIRGHYLEPAGAWARERIERVLEALSPRPGERILDLGCALGTFSFHCARRAAKPVGLDRDREALLKGREAAARMGDKPAPRVRGDARALPFRDGVFDAVANADFIEHVPDAEKPPIFREMHRVMKHGGRGVVYTPNRARVEWELRGERLKRALGLRREPVPAWRTYVDPDHFGLATPGEARAALVEAGFETDVRYYEFHVPLLSRIPGFDALIRPLLAARFSNRFLVRVRKP